MSIISLPILKMEGGAKLRIKFIQTLFSKTILAIVLVFFLQQICAQSTKIFAIDINSGRVLLDSFAANGRSVISMDSLKFKFDPFSTYSHAYDSKNSNFIIECDTAILVIKATGGLVRTIHKPGDVEGMVYDPINDKVYCVLWKVNTYFFTRLDLQTGLFSTIRSLSDNSVHSSALDYDGRYYYIISDTRGLFKINMNTGVKVDSVKYFTTNNCRCNALDVETGKIATTCVQNGQYVMQLYDPALRSFLTIDTLGKYGSGFFSYESASINQNTGNWYLNLGKKIGVKNIRTNAPMDTFTVPYNRIRSLTVAEGLCYRPLLIAGFAKQNPTCFNSDNGIINISATGGRPPYAYAINNQPFNTNSNFTNLRSANYKISVQDKYGFCNVSSAITLQSPDSFQNKSQVISNACYGYKSGKVVLNISGALSPYMYAINNDTFSSDSVFTGLGNGTYQFKVKDANNCLDTIQGVQITSPPVLSIDSVHIKNIRCFGQRNGEVSFTASGGVLPYQTFMDSISCMSTKVIRGLDKGIHSLVIKDYNQCVVAKSIFIEEPYAFKSVPSITNSQCYGFNNGALKVRIAGGVNKDSFWYDLNGLFGNKPISDTLHSLKPGVYKLVVWNQNTCKDSVVFNITEPPVLKIGLVRDTALCNGQQVKVDLHNELSVTYKTISNTGLQFYSDTLMLDKAGTYFFEAANSNGCKWKDTFSITKVNLNVTHDFLMPTVAFLTDTIYAVNISSPLADKSEWLLDPSTPISFLKDPFTIHLLPKDTGRFQITLQSRYNLCGYKLTKPLTIESNRDSSLVDAKFGYQGPLIQNFDVFANPHNGRDFTIRIQLRDTANFSIYKIDPASGYITAEMHFTDLKSHTFTAFTSTKSEIYYLKLIACRESKVIKVVVVY